MKKLFITSLASISLAALSATVLADTMHGKRYMGADVGFMQIENDNSSADADITHLTGRLGGYLNDNVAFEGRVGLGVTDDTVGGVDFSLRYLVGAYTRIGLPLADNKIFPYVLLGFTRADFQAEALGVETNDAETDTSYGIGADIDLSGIALTAEYLNLIDKNNATYSGFSIGLKTTF